MPINVIPIIPKRIYDFSEGGATVVERKAVDVTAATSGSLLVRVHEKDTFGSGGAVVVAVKVSSPSDEDPALDFVGSVVATASIDDTLDPAPPTLLKVDLEPEFGGFLWVEVVGTQGSAVTRVTLSAELAMKV